MAKIAMKILVVLICYFSLLFGNLFSVFKFSHRDSTLAIGCGEEDTFLHNYSNPFSVTRGSFQLNIENFGSDNVPYIDFIKSFVVDEKGNKNKLSGKFNYGGGYNQSVHLYNNDYLYCDFDFYKYLNLSSTFQIRIYGNSTIEDKDPNLPIVFQDSNLTLSLGLIEPLKNRIIFSSDGTCKIHLLSDLKLGDGVYLGCYSPTIYVYDGTVDLNGKTLEFGGEELTHDNNILWENAGDIKLNARMNLSGTWTFSGLGVINGNGNILDVSQGGALDLLGSSTLYLTDIVVLGIKDSTFVFQNDDCYLHLCNVHMQLDENTSFTLGNIYVDGPSTIITHDKVLTFNQESNLTISAVTLWRDEAGASSGNIVGGSANLDLVYNGTIKLMADGALVRDNSDAIVYLDDCCDDVSTLAEENSEAIIGLEDYVNTFTQLVTDNSEAIVYLDDCCDTVTTLLAENSEAILSLEDHVNTFTQLIVDNSDAIDAIDVEAVTNLAQENSEAILGLQIELDSIDHGPGDIAIGGFESGLTMNHNIYLGPDHKMIFNLSFFAKILNGESYYIHFSRDNISLIETNVSSNVFTLTNVVLKDFSPTHFNNLCPIKFGDSVTIELCKDETLTYVWTFTAQGRIKGFGNTLTLGDGGRIETSANNNLILEDLIISGVSHDADNLRCIFNGGSITLKNSRLLLEGDYTFSWGSMIFEDEVYIEGPSRTFAYATSETSTINSESILHIDYDVTFSYDPPYANRDLLAMSGITSQLFLDGCILHSTTTGMRLKNGTVMFDNFVTISAEGQNTSESISFGDVNTADLLDGVRTEVLSGARIEVYGYVDIK